MKPDHIRYAQVWEDADILLPALDPRPGATLAVIGSAGDNALALLTADPARLWVIDRSPAQQACLRLRLAAFRLLDHDALLELLGARKSARRGGLLDDVLATMTPVDAAFWSERRDAVIAHGAAGVGRFERYFRVFRRWVLPLVHGRQTIAELLTPNPRAQREKFFVSRWNTSRWRLLLMLFFGRRTMAALGRDPAFFARMRVETDADLAAHVARRVRHALVELDPTENPYLHWILLGHHDAALPLAWRPEHFATIRARLDRIEPLTADLADLSLPAPVDGWGLSDVFEYMDPETFSGVFERLLDLTAPGGRLAYWCMMVPRRVPPALESRVRCHDDLAAALWRRDKAFFYAGFRVEERSG